MRIKEIEYSRLFDNIPGFQNERIGFKAEIDENEDQNQVMGELCIRAINLNKKFSEYRSVLAKLESIEQNIDNLREEKQRLNERIKDLLAERENLDKSDEKQRCRAVDLEDHLEQTKNRVQKKDETIEEKQQEWNELNDQKIKLETTITGSGGSVNE